MMSKASATSAWRILGRLCGRDWTRLLRQRREPPRRCLSIIVGAWTEIWEPKGPRISGAGTSSALFLLRPYYYYCSSEETVVEDPGTLRIHSRTAGPLKKGRCTSLDCWLPLNLICLRLALKSASEALLEKDVMMANAELQASNITTPNGNLTLCYDEMGDCCKVPEYCFVDPI